MGTPSRANVTYDPSSVWDVPGGMSERQFRSQRDRLQAPREEILLAAATLPDLMSAAIRGTNESYATVERPTASIHLPSVNEYFLGQLLQMLMLATVTEGRMMGINPYGQPGVEDYKKIMRRELGV